MDDEKKLSVTRQVLLQAEAMHDAHHVATEEKTPQVIKVDGGNAVIADLGSTRKVFVIPTEVD